MSRADLRKAPEAQGLIVRHDPWCPMSYGEGMRCAAGCSPTLELVDMATLAATMRRDFRNRSQRRAAAKAARRDGR
ncbi:MAG: hypothetical protein KGN16_01075 [Burkholderiales bacterium]|nr:hypothetical protein [Burkholderiales bacterium]